MYGLPAKIEIFSVQSALGRFDFRKIRVAVGKVRRMVKRFDALLSGSDVLESRGDLLTAITGVACDGRRVKPGDLFVAVRGVREDGAGYIPQALANGAAAVVTETLPAGPCPVPVAVVADARKTLARAAAVFYDDPAEELCFVGVTGTNGKTTTTLLLEGILRRAGHSVGVIGTIAYRWAGKERKAPMTTPESLDLQRLFREMRDDGVTHVVMEVSSHALALGRVDGIRFRVAVFSNLSQDHLDFHSGMEDYFNAKMKLFTPAHEGDAPPVAVVNADDPYGRRILAGLPPDAWSYSVTGAGARVRVVKSELTPSSIRAVLESSGEQLEIRSSLMGRLNLYNLTAAATAALALGIPSADISGGLEDVHAVDGRIQRVPVPEAFGFHVVVDYAHTPDAMEKTLECLRETTFGRLIVVFGCGGDRDRRKRPLMGAAAARWGDRVIVTSDNPRSEEPDAIIAEIEPGLSGAGIRRVDVSAGFPEGKVYTVEPDRRRAIELALDSARPGDLVFIGGKGHETYQLVKGKTLSFDDRAVAAQWLQARLQLRRGD